jgi:galactan 5-O-arabinofuranosyltransferase
MQILGTAMFGPAAYVAWRLVLKPGWALAIGVVATLPLYDQVKPYRNIVLMVLVPVLLAFFRKVRRAEGLSVRDCVKAGIAYGAGFALLFLTYSGWFVWFAPGVVAAVLLLAPWRQGLRQVLWLLGVTGFTFVVVSWIHLGDLLGAGGAVSDSFMYFDTNTEPAYIAMWRDDRALDLNDMPWPPPAELGNVGLFTVLLVIGLAVALWLGWRRTPVIVLVCGIAGAWVIRMYLASRMYDTQLVRLYPRTTTILLYMLLVLTGLGVMYAFGRGAEFLRDSGRRPGVAVPVALLLVPLMLFFASASSATANRLMPDPRVHAYGWFSWIAHTTSLYDGTCPKYGILHGGCDQPLDLTNRLR